jgi:hypothetical protein
MTLQDLENAVAGLPPDELSRFRVWFAEFDAAAWDQQFEDDVRAGRLDALAAEALEDLRGGRTTECRVSFEPITGDCLARSSNLRTRTSLFSRPIHTVRLYN